jgi:hypothetical protein
MPRKIELSPSTKIVCWVGGVHFVTQVKHIVDNRLLMCYGDFIKSRKEDVERGKKPCIGFGTTYEGVSVQISLA